MTPAQLLASRGMDLRLAPAAGALLELLQAYGIRWTVSSVRRSFAKQASLYWRSLWGIHKYPVALPGTSSHEVGRAMDLVLYPPVYAAAGAIWRAWGGQWSPADEIHFAA